MLLIVKTIITITPDTIFSVHELNERRNSPYEMIKKKRAPKNDPIILHFPP